MLAIMHDYVECMMYGSRIVGYDVCMIHDLEGELYEYDFEGETAADDDCCKLLEDAAVRA